MKRFIQFSIIFILVASGIFLLGPRPESNDEITFNATLIDDDLAAYIEQKEDTYSNITPGAEREIIWADPNSKNQTEISVVYIHGFSATKYEIKPVPDLVASALGANLYYTRLTGHGQTGEELAEAKLSDWANDYAEAIEIGRRLGKRVLVLSTSTGSTLATWAHTKPDLSSDLLGIVMLSPNFATKALPTAVGNMPWAETILPLLGGNHRSWEPYNEEQGKWWTTSYPSKAIFPMFALLNLVENIDKSEIKTPLFMAFSHDDQVIAPNEVEVVAGEWGGPVELITLTGALDPSNHVLAGDILGPDNTEPLSEKISEWALKLL